MPRILPIIVALCTLLVAAGCSLVENSESAPAGQPPAPETAAETGSIIINVETDPSAQAGAFTFTGVPSGTLTVDSTLVVADLAPGTYTTTQVNPAPDFDVSAASCDDSAEGLASSADAQTRTAVVNLDAGETVTCTFTNAQRATAVVASQTEPEGAAGQLLFTGVPSGTIPANGTLVVAQLPPGTYTTTAADPAPQFDLTAVNCDDDGSATVSAGDPSTRSAIFQLDPGEMVTCTFTNTRRGAAVVTAEIVDGPDDVAFQYTGVPSGTISAGGSLVVADLSPGTYTSTEVDPGPDYELVEISCDDGAGGLASSGDPSTRSAIFNIDPGETVTCNYVHEYIATELAGDDTSGTGGNGSSDTDERAAKPGGGGENPFIAPDRDFENFPVPGDLPADAGTYDVPLAGPWTAYNQAGQMDCGVAALPIPAEPAEGGTLEVLDGGQTLVGSGITTAQSEPITMTANPNISGRYFGAFEATEQGVPIVIDFFWQVVTEEYIVGYLTSTFSAEGVSCSIYRPFELRYAG